MNAHIVYAQEDINASEPEADIERQRGLYLTFQPMMTFGGSTDNEEGEKLSSENGYGVGLEFGYYFFSQFAVELAVNTSNNIVTNEVTGDKGTGIYYSAAINAVYRQPVYGPLFILAKVGGEWEEEQIVAFDFKESNVGIDYALGVAYEVTEKFALMIQYESSTMGGIRGDALFIGAVEYSF